MLQVLCKLNLAKCAGRAYQHFHPYRILSSVLGKDQLCHRRCTENACNEYFRPTSCSIHSVASCTSSGGYEGKPSYATALGMLVGALGAVTVLGLGTVFSKTQENDEQSDMKLVDASTKSATLSEVLLKRDPLAIEKKGNELEEKISSAETSGLYVVTGGSEHKEKISSAETSGLSVVRGGSRHCRQQESVSSLDETVRKARKVLRRHMEEVGAPGMVVAVTVNGEQIWADGLGFADLEQGVRCSPATVMRIASISKALTMTAVARLWEEGKLDLDAPIQKYIPSFPVKTYDGKEVTITVRHLLSHQSGIRHYKLKDSKKQEGKKKENSKMEKKKECQLAKGDKKCEEIVADSVEGEKVMAVKQILATSSKVMVKQKENDTATEEPQETRYEENTSSSDSDKENVFASRKEKEKSACNTTHPSRIVCKSKKKKKKEEEEDEFDLEEYYISEEFETVQEALKLFQNDDLFFKPGEGYLYTTHGWTVVSAVLEVAAQMPFTEVTKRLFYELGLHNTYLDEASPIIHNRASYYIRDKHGKLKNAPYVNNSYKWAGGGFLSTVGDLCKFGNAMLYSSQQDHMEGTEDMAKLPGYLKASTLQHLWTPVEGTTKGWRDRAYGLGWEAVQGSYKHGFCRSSQHHAFHSGGAVGASSILLVLPQQETSTVPPQGVVVALLTNMQGVGLYKVALEVAELFKKIQ